jgi:hypothetical protein
MQVVGLLLCLQDRQKNEDMFYDRYIMQPKVCCMFQNYNQIKQQNENLKIYIYIRV